MTKAQNTVRVEQSAPEEWLSALMDGELADDGEAREMIGRLAKDQDALGAWTEYGLIGDAMRGCAWPTSRLEKRFKAALAVEPTVLAPVAGHGRQPAYWVAAAAAVAAITWTVLSVTPAPNPAVTVAANGSAGAPAAAGAVRTVSDQSAAENEVMPYLTAHQDYAFTVAGEPVMHITQVSYPGNAR